MRKHFQKKISGMTLISFLSICLSAGEPETEATSSEFINGLFEFFHSQPFLVLFIVLAVGLLLGKIKFKDISLGSSGVLFTALLAGHAGFQIPGIIGKLGLILFVYCVGITAGPTFFSAFRKQGGDLAKIAVLAVGSGTVAAYLAALLLRLEPALAAGIFAGAMTSTPGLASALDALGEQGNMASIGYGIAYPFGVIGVVLFVQLLPRFVGENEAGDKNREANDDEGLARALLELRNPELNDLPLHDLAGQLAIGDFCVSRLMKNKRLVPVSTEDIYREGSVILIVAPKSRIPAISARLGRESDLDLHMDVDHQRMEIIVTSGQLTGNSIQKLEPLREYGITVSRISRDGHTFLANPESSLEYGDVLTAVGEQDALANFAKLAGHREKALHETDLLTFCAGLVLGVGAGLIPIVIPGGGNFSLGLAGGPLFVALLIGYLRRCGFVSGYMPRASRQLMMELGLIFFLAEAGTRAGNSLLPVMREHGPMLFLGAAAVTLLPMLVCWFAARFWLRMSMLEALGGICGGMTSTPALGALTASTDSSTPVTSYATAYPVALILMTIFVQLLIALLK